MRASLNLLLLASGLQSALTCSCSGPGFSGSDAGIAEHRAKFAQRDLVRRANSTTSKPRSIALDNVRFFNDRGFSEPTTVLIDGPKIGLIGHNLTVRPDTRIDCTGQFLLPGLFDTHTHPGSLDDMKNLTKYGVTTTIGASCGNLTLCNELKNLPGITSFITAGIPATAPGNQNLAFPGATSEGSVASYDDIPLFMASNVGNGSELVKLRSQNGGFNQSMQTAIAEEGHKYGQLVMTHAVDYASWERAIPTGTDLIHHTITDAVVSDEMIQRVIGLGIYNVPTLRVHQQGYMNGYYNDAGWANITTNARKVYTAGVKLLVGTDAHSGGLPELYFPFGSSLHEELVLLNQAGWDPLYILQGASSLAAEAFGFDDRGYVRSGMRADLLLVGGNPLVDIANTQKIKKVWVGGEEYMG